MKAVIGIDRWAGRDRGDFSTQGSQGSRGKCQPSSSAISAIPALKSWHVKSVAIVSTLMVLSLGCSRSPESPSQRSPSTMREVTLPDLSRMDPSVQVQVRERYQSMLDTIKKPGVTEEERG